MEKLQALLKSRRFWAAASGLLVVLTNGLGLSIEPEVIEQIVMLIAAWVIGDSIHKTVE